jgi:hypothetical protein
MIRRKTNTSAQICEGQAGPAAVKKQTFINDLNYQDSARMRLSSIDIMNKFGRENAVDLLGMMNSQQINMNEPDKTKGSISSPKPTNKDYYQNPRHHLVKVNKNHAETNIRFNIA